MIKKLVKSFFNYFGYEIKNRKYKDIFSVRHSMYESFEQIKSCGFYPDLVIDVGAANGTSDLQKAFEKSTFFWIEPLDEFENNLISLKKKFHGDYLIGALGKESGKININIQHDKVGSSILMDLDEDTTKKESRETPLYTLKELAETKFQGYKKILLKIDVQGYELEVLMGAVDFLFRIDVIILEVSFFRFYRNCPDFYDVLGYMKKNGFVVYDIVGGVNRPNDYALAQKDIVFVKEHGLFRTSHKWD